MLTMKMLGSWSLSEFKDMETLDDLLWWHNRTVQEHNKKVKAGRK